MSNTATWAEKAVSAFKNSLDENKRQQLSEADYERLALIINETLGDALLNATEQFDAVVKKLRAGIDKQELGI